MAIVLAFAPPGPARAQDYHVGTLTIVHPWSRATPGGAKIAGGYLVVDNAGDAPDRLVGATVEVAGRASPHEMAMADGVMTMRALPDGLVVPAHGSVALKPGSLHLMFEDLKRALKKGDTFKGTLTFAVAGTVGITFVVESLGAREPGGAMPGMNMN